MIDGGGIEDNNLEFQLFLRTYVVIEAWKITGIGLYMFVQIRGVPVYHDVPYLWSF